MSTRLELGAEAEAVEVEIDDRDSRVVDDDMMDVDSSLFDIVWLAVVGHLQFKIMITKISVEAITHPL